MDEKIDKAIGILLDQIRTNLKPAETGSHAINAATSTLTWYGEKVTGKKSA